MAGRNAWAESLRCNCKLTPLKVVKAPHNPMPKITCNSPGKAKTIPSKNAPTTFTSNVARGKAELPTGGK